MGVRLAGLEVEMKSMAIHVSDHTFVNTKIKGRLGIEWILLGVCFSISYLAELTNKSNNGIITNFKKS